MVSSGEFMTKSSNHLIRVANIVEEGRIGGPQIRIALIASALNSKKIHTTVIFPKKDSRDFQKLCKKNGISYLMTPITTLRRDLVTIFLYIISFPFEVLMLSKILKNNRYDVVHLSGGSWQYKGLFAAKLAGVKVIWHLNDTYTPVFIRGIFSLVSYFANSFIYASYRTKKYYEKLIPNKNKNFLIQSPVDINFFNPDINFKVKKFYKKINLKNKIVIGTVANVNPVKGLETFLKAAVEISSNKKDVIFLIIGSVHHNQRKYYTYLINIIKENKLKNVFFINSRKDIRPLLKIFDIYVCSSNNESSPMSVWEAMSMKKAIVSTDVGDVKNFIINKVNGFIVKVGDHEALAKRVVTLIKTPKLRYIFGKLVRNIAKNKLDLKVCVNLHINAYKKTIKHD